MAVRLYKRTDWELRLRQLGCKPDGDAPNLKTAEIWKTKNGDAFTVPCEYTGHCGEYELARVMLDLVKLGVNQD